jgi:hypothetical protein
MGDVIVRFSIFTAVRQRTTGREQGVRQQVVRGFI